MSVQKPVRIGLIGAGIFARKAHIPAMMQLGPDVFQVVAVCSRTKKSAQACAADIPYAVDITTETDALLEREDIDAIDLILPIDLMPGMTAKALTSGKHILSEKPVAPDVASGRQLLAQYTGERVWMVAENQRYHDTFVKAAELVKDGTIGRPLLGNWIVHIPFTPGNPYYGTAWRKDGGFPGGIFLDGGVHNMAGLRMLFGEARRVNALAAFDRDDLPGVSTISNTIEFDSGAIVNLSVTFSAPKNASSPPLVVCGDQGTLKVDFEKVELVRGNQKHLIHIDGIDNVRNEFAAFAAAIRDGQPHTNTPEQALQDVALVEAALLAAESGEIVVPERIV
jgi:predicted dehydrogenase